MRKFINTILSLAMVFALLSCSNPFQPPPAPAPKPPEVIQPAPAPTPAPPVVVKPKLGLNKPIIYVDMKRGTFGLNKTAMNMVKSGRYVIHLNYGYVYDICKIVDGQQVRESHDWYPDSIKKLTVGVYDTVTGKYVVSVRVL